MFKKSLIICMTAFTVAGNAIAGNPFFEPYNTPHQTIPFDKIKTEHYMPAFEEGMKQQDKEIQAIVNNPKAPTFENTIAALDKSGELLDKVSSAFYNLLSAETNDDLQKVAQELSPKITEHGNTIRLNEKLFARIKAVYDQKDKLKLTPEQKTLLQETYDGFADNGANLSAADKEKYRELSKELSMLSLTFSQNVLKETNKYQMVITDKKLLSGLSDDMLDMLASNAKKAGKDGWLIDLKTTSYVPVMKYADNRDLRRELYMANATKCMSGGEYDNRENIRKIANLRLEISNLLGYKSYAEHALKRRMAENEENVYKLLNQLLEAYKPVAEKEYAEVQAYADKNGAYFKIQPWDWSYYSEKLKAEKYNLNDEMLRPYFELEKVRQGIFDLANKLYGLKFTLNTKIPVYNPEVKAYDVTDANGKFIAVYYADNHPREGKRAGAWMNDMKAQWMEGKTDSRPQIVNVTNFTRPTSTKPALLTFDEVTTMLHEFGHGLHGMLSKTTYRSLSCTNVYRDFVELPSQIMENWAVQKDFLDMFASNYLSGEKIPAEMIQRIKDADNFNAANFTLRQLSFGLLDMAWHTLEQPYEGDVIALEKQAMMPTQILPVVENTAMSPTFSHIFSGGYAAGYYSYKWAEVLDADAFSVFQQNGIFDKKTADSFRKNILEKGGTEHPMVLYKRFRGQEPTIDALLKRNGIK
ncbi:Peptidyl-dipeptidase Dcp [uncultured Paludibacter sp.]|uniref:Peptidyl-dipeptidase Dcp n=1 Tax=uncultured Paludibacter sp. TaxID=497635 RepID=A0A653ACR1_9BACT|nr:Peptidyl-dipeptidase Dcp [uncultured Paludibacter sp.]